MIQSNQTIDTAATGTVQQQVAVQPTPVTTTEMPAQVPHNQAKDIASSYQVTGIAMAAIFGFMVIFFLVIKGIDKLFPYKEEKK